MSVYDDLRPTRGECLLHLAPGSHCAKPKGHDLNDDTDHQDNMSAEHEHCGDEPGFDRLACELCLEGQPCIEHRTQAKESAARDAAERSRS